MSRVTVLPVLVVTVAYGLSGPSWVFAAVLMVLALVATVLRQRLRLGRAPELLLGAILFLVALVVLATLLPRPPSDQLQLPTGWAAFTGASLLLAVLRLFLAAPWGGHLATLVIAMAAMAGSGGTADPSIYPWLVAPFIAAALLARRYEDSGRAPLRSLGLRFLLPMALGGGVVLLAARFWIGWLPELYDSAVRALISSGGNKAGFSDRMWLGSMRGMLSSNERVMRIRGSGDHELLRGIVYTHYRAGRWSQGDGQESQISELPSELPPGDDVTEIEFVDREPVRYFLPLEAGEVAVATGMARVDRAAILAPVAAEPADRIWFRTDARRMNSVAPPDRGDTELPAGLVAPLRRLAQEWTAGGKSDGERLLLIERRLQQDFVYSLHYERRYGDDPVLLFLLQDRQGHCEYFASAMTLLARSLGIPARLVGGYRMSEYNGLGGYHLVRERNAHAWVEAWTGASEWRTYDPTPPAALPRPAVTPMSSALVDLLAHGWAGFLSWLDQRSPQEMVALPFGALLFISILRWLRSVRQRLRRRHEARSELPLPCFVRLSDALARRGFARPEHETVEAFAARVSNSELEQGIGVQAAKLLQRYAALRYGGHGESKDLSTDVERLLTKMSRSRALV